MTAWWQATFQTTIDAYYHGDLTAGLLACEQLNVLEDLPDEIARYTRQNLVFYTPALAILTPSFRAQRIEIPVPEGWSCHNPSIAAADDGFRLILRSANYRIEPPRQYVVHADDGIVRTTNYLLELAPNFSIRDAQVIDDRALRPEPPLFIVAGFEDCRLFFQRDHWWASATVRDRDPQGMSRAVLLRLDGATAVKEHLLSDGSDHEKNWMPVVGGKSLRFVYSCFPTTLLRFDRQKHRVSRVGHKSAPYLAGHFRGGSQVIPFDGGYLCLIHEVVITEEEERRYLHRWVWFSHSWRLRKISPPFVFQGPGIEFAAGLAQQGDRLVVSYGVWDREAWLATVDAAEVRQLLAPPHDPAVVEAGMRIAAAMRNATGKPLAGPSAKSAAASPVDSQLRIVSTTLTGNNRKIIGDALRSVVDWVDACLVIDTGITDDTLDVARAIAGDKLIVRSFPWRDDFAAARNFALDAAHELGAGWAVTLDSDERLVRGEADIHALLAASTADALHVKHVNGTYGKQRFFRLPARGRFRGLTHEAFMQDVGGNQTLTGVQFDELEKSAKQYRRKVERDIAILTRQIAEQPHDPRWHYYLGDSLAGLDRHEEAVAAFRACASLDGWDEEAGWSMYRAAECLIKLDRLPEAIAACTEGMTKHAAMPELPWLAAFASWKLGQMEQAVAWANLAAAGGHFSGNGASVHRIGFRHPPALWEGPYDVLRYALRSLGDNARADEAELLYQAARAAREQNQ